MTGQRTLDDETSPLLGHQRSESDQTLVANENTQKTDDKKASGGSLVWILAAVWSAIFLCALDGTLPRSTVSTGHYTCATQEPLSRRCSPQSAHTSIVHINRLTLAPRICCPCAASRRYTGDYRISLDVEERCYWHCHCLGRGRFYVALHHR